MEIESVAATEAAAPHHRMLIRFAGLAEGEIRGLGITLHGRHQDCFKGYYMGSGKRDYFAFLFFLDFYRAGNKKIS